MSGEVHISSLVVHSRPGCGEAVAAAIAALPGAEVSAISPEGKIVVVFETATMAAILDHIDTIQSAPEVLGAALVFHGVDETAPEEKTRSIPCP